MANPNRFYVLLILAAINFTHIVDAMLIMPLGDIFIEEFKISAQQYSFLVSSYAVAAAISSLAGIFLLDRFDRKSSLNILYIGFALGTLACGFCNSYESLVITRFCTGLFGGMIGAIVLSIISDLYPFKERGSAMGILFAAFSAASALGVPIGIYLAAISNWQLPFIILGSLALVINVVVYFLLPKLTSHLQSQNKEEKLWTPVVEIFTDKNQVNALFTGFILILAHFMIIPFISPFMIKNIGFTQEEIALQFFFGGVATLFTAPIIGKLTDKRGVFKVFTTVMLLSFIPTVVLTNLYPVPIWVALCFTTLFFVLGSGRMISPNTIITAAAPTKNRGAFMSLKSSLQQMAIALSGIISGAIIFIDEDNLYQNYDLVGYIAIAFGLITIYFIRKIKVAEGN